ncbi:MULTISPECIES: hypothetical protein [Gracilibacillus]|uniref:hypothetical protein n=1 Tax=Gracilibacillus TaxID=74385 RepID=UPI000824EBB7|nr:MULTISPECIES: hypothetical protein [Gracilibacillus]
MFLLLFIILHQINQYQHQQQLQQINEEQYKLEMLYQKAYHLIQTEEPSSLLPLYSFPDGTITISPIPDTMAGQAYQLELTSDTGGFRQMNFYLQE